MAPVWVVLGSGVFIGERVGREVVGGLVETIDGSGAGTIEERPQENGTAVLFDLALQRGSDRAAMETAELHPLGG